jgi:L-alanine-DL-glutamate epimerase-like enolase superfamily enzyme
MLHEPPGMSSADFQWYLKEPLQVNAQGDIEAPNAPGLGVEPDPDKLAKFRI